VLPVKGGEKQGRGRGRIRVSVLKIGRELGGWEHRGRVQGRFYVRRTWRIKSQLRDGVALVEAATYGFGQMRIGRWLSVASGCAEGSRCQRWDFVVESWKERF
jgi:hypothetical protein